MIPTGAEFCPSTVCKISYFRLCNMLLPSAFVHLPSSTCLRPFAFVHVHFVHVANLRQRCFQLFFSVWARQSEKNSGETVRKLNRSIKQKHDSKKGGAVMRSCWSDPSPVLELQSWTCMTGQCACRHKDTVLLTKHNKTCEE